MTALVITSADEAQDAVARAVAGELLALDMHQATGEAWDVLEAAVVGQGLLLQQPRMREYTLGLRAAA